METTSIEDLNKIANELRIDVLKMLTEAGTGHTASPLGLAELFSAMYFSILNHDPKNPKWEKRDRFVVSCGHVAPIRYAALAKSGYFDDSELQTLRKLGSKLQGHPNVLDMPELETSSGPLGQGTSMAVGMALAAKMKSRLLGDPPKRQDHFVYLLMSDGEQQEGQTWEAAMMAAKNNLGNIIAFIDQNNIQISGKVEDVMPVKSLTAKYASFGWHVQEINGHNIPEILKSVKIACLTKDQPSVIILNTVPGKGVDFMEEKAEWHGKVPNREELEKAILEISNI